MKSERLHAVLCLLLVAGDVLAVTDTYCEGFDKGFAQRYCLLTNNAAVDALPPVCPEPLFGAESAQDGYNRGFLVGLNAAHLCVLEENDAEPGATTLSTNQGQSPGAGIER